MKHYVLVEEKDKWTDLFIAGHTIDGVNNALGYSMWVTHRASFAQVHPSPPLSSFPLLSGLPDDSLTKICTDHRDDIFTALMGSSSPSPLLSFSIHFIFLRRSLCSTAAAQSSSKRFISRNKNLVFISRNPFSQWREQKLIAQLTKELLTITTPPLRKAEKESLEEWLALSLNPLECQLKNLLNFKSLCVWCMDSLLCTTFTSS
jgi:hypothetical protein